MSIFTEDGGLAKRGQKCCDWLYFRHIYEGLVQKSIQLYILLEKRTLIQIPSDEKRDYSGAISVLCHKQGVTQLASPSTRDRDLNSV